MSADAVADFIAVYDGMTATDLTAYFLKTTAGRRAYNANVKYFRSRRAVIRSNQSLPIAADADVVPERKVLEIEVVPGAISVVVGNGTALGRPVEAVQSTPPLAGEQPAPKNGSLTPEKAGEKAAEGAPA